MWSDVLNDWENGIPLKYPKGLKRFQWNTSVLKEGAPFKQSFKEDLRLAQTQDLTAFREY